MPSTFTLIDKPMCGGGGCKEYRQHRLVLYTDTGCSIGAYSVPALGSPVPFEIKGEGGVIMVCWYASLYDEQDGIWAQEQVACGSGTSIIQLLDLQGKTQGEVRLSGVPQVTTQLATRPDRSLIELVKTVYTENHLPPDELFTDVGVFVGRFEYFPVVFFALPTLQPGPDATGVFQRLLELAKRFAHPGTQTDDRQMLADLISFPSLGWVYRSDTDRSGKETDIWSTLLHFPGPGPLSYDCEDGAKALMELFMLFQTVTLDTKRASKDLLRIQRLARGLTPYMAIGELKCRGKGHEYVMHCYVVLLDPCNVQPAITLESTTYASGVWDTHAPASDKANRAIVKRASDVVYAKCDAVTNYNARLRCPMSMVRDEGVYGRLLALFSCTAGEDRAETIHYIFRDVQACEFFAHPCIDTHKPITPIRMPTAQFRDMFHPQLMLLPRPPTLPLPGSTPIPSLSPTRTSLLLPVRTRADNVIDVWKGLNVSHCMV